MPIQIYPKESAAKADPQVKALLEHLQEHEQALEIGTAVIFYNFPLFREDERLLVADLVIASPIHGVLLVSIASDGRNQSSDDIARLEGTFSQVFSRLVRYPRLRSGRAQLLFNLDAFIWTAEGVESARDELVIGFGGIDTYFKEHRRPDALAADIFDELISVLDGSKALLKTKERRIEGFSDRSKIAVIARLEEEIRRFDRDQRIGYMTEVDGLQRIRGLAGSGKTVVLALKAAMTAIRYPNASIAVTFYTKSLYQHIKQLITRFYRMHEDRDPDWSKLRVVHGWGGGAVEGLYYLVAKRFGQQPLSFGQAQLLSYKQPFGAACEKLMVEENITPVFDYIFVDEAQDFPPEFMRLALRLCVDEKLVVAYDVFQTIFDVEVPTAASLFGTDKRNEPPVDFDEDIILHKCYRNPREVLVCAHAIGFGIYGRKVAQMLESEEHWEDFGYEVVSGQLQPGEEIVIRRPEENSPSSISKSNTIEQIINVKACKNVGEEVSYITGLISKDVLTEGVPAEDILVICADDRNASGYFRLIARELGKYGIRVNDLQEDSYSLKDFQKEQCVTLSTIYKAKGNEAYIVYIVGIDALFHSVTPKNRNKAFTAMTRAKGWLYVTGVGEAAHSFAREINTAKEFFPNLRFRYPNEPELVLMKRDLSNIEPDDADEAISQLANRMEPEELEYLLKKRLRELQRKKRPKKKME